MSLENCQRSGQPSPPSLQQIQDQIHSICDDIIHFCIQPTEVTFYHAEQLLQSHISSLACLFFQLFLMSVHNQFDYTSWLEKGTYYKGELVSRTLKTLYGEVRYWRTYLIRKDGGGFYPLDAGIGLTGDGLSPLVMSLGTRLATRVSFAASVRLFRCFCGWAPSSDTIQQLVLGMGKDSVAYMDQAPVPPDDGEILVIEVDGKATPTATEAELKKRRGKRPQKPHTCRCARHRGQAKRACRGKKKRRKLGDKSKNGRSITLVVMYTLKQGDDGRLHGPINKRVWGSYAPRKVMLAWAREQATKRGFAPATAKRIHLVVDGEICLYDGLSTLFPQATFALDIRYVDERLSMMAYKDLIDEDMVIASGIVEGAARYVVGERLDCSGMRWIPERAEVLLHLRCIELNGDWERFFAWSYQRWLDQMQAGQRVLIRTNQADALPTAASIEVTDYHDLEPSQHATAA